MRKLFIAIIIFELIGMSLLFADDIEIISDGAIKQTENRTVEKTIEVDKVLNRCETIMGTIQEYQKLVDDKKKEYENCNFIADTVNNLISGEVNSSDVNWTEFNTLNKY